MADFILPVFKILTSVCGYCAKRADSIRNLRGDLKSLKNASNELDDRYSDVKRKVETAETSLDPDLMVLNEVRGWMCRVEALQGEVNRILEIGDVEIQAKCFGDRCPKNCCAWYELDNKVTKMLSEVKELRSKGDFRSRGDFDVVAEKCPHDLFEKHPVDKIVGAKSTFEELRSCFQNDECGIIGLYGMGGVGKTTLLKKFNNDFLPRDYVVIWVVASKGADEGKIQDDIMKKLGVQDDNWNDKVKVDDRAPLLYKILNKKKFVLLLDDVWKRIDLLKLGVPSPNDHECKIIFTTRLDDVCGQMEAKRCIRVECLARDEAFELFKEKVGAKTLEKPLLSLANQIVEECEGLPLALCVVGRAMANKTPTEWKHTLEFLRSYPSKIQGIVEDVYCSLECSYDRLPNDTYKSCFLYCALFPENHNIKKEELILLWIAEGCLVKSDYDVHGARKEGEYIISKLKHACLLEDGEKENTVKMHAVIRRMALWVSCDHEKNTRCLVNDYSKTSGLQVYNHAKWEEVEKLSIWGNGEIITNYFSQRLHCPNLVTLLLRNVFTPVFPTEVFVLSSNIRVLDLSGSVAISYLPSTIGAFVNLQHINLSYTGIKKLPSVLKNLRELRFLMLDGLKNLVLLKEVISSLLSLRAFSTRECKFSVIDEDTLLDELEGLEYLQDIRICISSPSSFQKILISSKLQRCMCELLVRQCSVPHDLILALGKMEHLESLIVEDNKISEDLEAVNVVSSSILKHDQIIMLRYLCLHECHDVVDLNWLIHAPNLEVLELVECDFLEDVVNDVVNEDIGTVKNNLFANLTFLRLQALDNLRSICRVTLQFLSLKEIEVSRCPNLKKLPFNSESDLTNLRRVVGDHEWFHQLQWEDEDTKNLLSSKFKGFFEEVDKAIQHHLPKFG